ncbi:kinase-like protein [Nadsonia fulvescens var. elongata DSM 6958]|uniref:Kinase-like protein n=1 Tax=Nadsonia fulvescens var. elongata DSM 6958 TaxID=857566 RepID=A0A1E3PIE1_9ASCO|nr:kinase-like protein [Nadsonia fulvescens var. elongata DSM 6958]
MTQARNPYLGSSLSDDPAQRSSAPGDTPSPIIGNSSSQGPTKKSQEFEDKAESAESIIPDSAASAPARRNSIFATTGPYSPVRITSSRLDNKLESCAQFGLSSSPPVTILPLSHEMRQPLRLSIPTSAPQDFSYDSIVLDSANHSALSSSPSLTFNQSRPRSSSISSLDLAYNDILSLPSPIVSSDTLNNAGIFNAFNGRSPPPISSISRFPTIRRQGRGGVATSSASSHKRIPSNPPLFMDLSLESTSMNHVTDLPCLSSVHTPTDSPSSPDSKRSISDYVPTPLTNSLVNTPGLPMKANNSPIILQKSPTIDSDPIIISKRGAKKSSPNSASSSSSSSHTPISSALPHPQYRSATYNFTSALKPDNLAEKSRTPPGDNLSGVGDANNNYFDSRQDETPKPSSIKASEVLESNTATSSTYTTLTSDIKIPMAASKLRRGPITTGSPNRVSFMANYESAGKSVAPEKENIFDAYDIDMNKTSWRAIRTLGRGAFSKVVLAIPHRRSSTTTFLNTEEASGTPADAKIDSDDNVENNVNAVAIKITNVTAAGGASRDRIESGLMRELDILKNVQHPSLIRLLGFNMDSDRALFILPYCRGGDLFILASQYRTQLTPILIRRIMAELIQAVMYLHKHYIVHRDIKLDNVLINMPIDQLLNLSSPESFPKALITLTDLGLSRIIDPENPMLTTRCGSEDYVPPELLMGQPYDGRQTDVWALGVLIYAIMEGRLPFDAPKNIGGGRSRGRTAHRIARVEWSWINLKDDPDVIWDRDAWNPAKAIVEGCLRKRDVRLTVTEIAESSWIKDGLNVELTESYCCIPDALSNRKWT